MPSSAISVAICAVTVLLIGLGDFPVSGGILLLLCAIGAAISLTDGITYLRGRMDTFDPRGLIGVIGFFFFLVSPVLQYEWDYWPFITPLTKDLDWISLWAALNILGLVLYRFTAGVSGTSRSHTGGTTMFYGVRPRMFKIVLVLGLVFSAAMQLYVYSKFGGVEGFIDTFTERQTQGVSEEDPFEGMGMPMLFAESFKILFAIFVVYLMRGKAWARSNFALVSVMAAFFVIFLFFGGLRGSRSSTVFAVFFAAGMYHFWVRPITVKFVAYGAIFAAIFLPTYYWYKIAGTEGLVAIFDESRRQTFHTARQDATKYIVARDLGRMDIQALAMKRYYEDDALAHSYGRTFVTSIFSVVPKSIIPFKPDQVTKEKTEILYGSGSYVRDSPRQTTLVLGQFGEFFVNFSYPGILLFYAMLGLAVGRIRLWINTWHPDDVRRLFLPILAIVPILMLITDMNVLILNITRYALFPALLLIPCIRKRTLRPAADMARILARNT